MTLQILGIGTAVPSELVTQEDAAQQAAGVWEAGNPHASTVVALYNRSGVKKRHSVVLASSTNGQAAQQSFYRTGMGAAYLGPSTAQRMRRYEIEALSLAEQASCAALEDADSVPSQIDHLITVSCTGFCAPGVDIGLIERLGLPRDVSRTHIGFMGCHGALNGLRAAGALATAEPGARVLMCCVELCSLHHQYSSDVQQIIANALFSDGAAAVVGAAGSSTRDAWQIIDQRSALLPDCADLMGWRIGDHGFEMTLSREVPELIQQTVRPWLSAWLAEHALRVGDIGRWAIHPGGPRILAACSEGLGLPADALSISHEILADYGNMSSPTVLFILERLRQMSAALPCVALAFGPGLTVEAALIDNRSSTCPK